MKTEDIKIEIIDEINQFDLLLEGKTLQEYVDCLNNQSCSHGEVIRLELLDYVDDMDMSDLTK